MILKAFLRAIAQIGDPRFRRVLFLGVVLTLGLLIATTIGFVWLINAVTGPNSYVPILGEVTWVNDLLGWGVVLVMMVLSVFLMVPVASAITSLFLDQVANAVEDRRYPHLPPANSVPIWDGLRDTISFLGVLIVANIFALILYVFLPFAAVFIFWGLNGFLLGREYFTLAAMRRVGRARAKEMRRQHRATLWAAGTLMAIPLTIPLLNLMIPILGAATFTNLFHLLNRTD
ncbi:MAG: EI24 domain-containing protein [Paracoccaceae bacterium]